ncbi:hypothetical protein [Natrinema pallidum]|uniref:hypothetical protein n=1 Tax=Natrinema pallidum TaxID=69527 RepID=UPI0037537E08
MPAQFTTDLPDEDQPVLGNGVKDEIAVDRETALSNYGSVRIQIRETGESSWDSNAAGFGEFIGNYDTLTMEFVGLKDGEEYEARARTETEHVTGEWTEPVSIITQFPGATNLEIVSTSSTNVELTWQDNADNEDGQLIIRERRWDGEWGRERVAGDAGPDAESYVDDGAHPDAEYRYRVRPYTEHSQADSNLETASTPELSDIRSRRIPPRGPYVEVEADDGTVRKPSVLEINPNPSLNDYPRVEISVPRDESWQDDRWDEADLRVWRDGERLPIDQLERPEVTPSETILHGLGGSDLDQYVERQIDFKTVHEALETILTEETDLAVDVDDPGGETDLTMQSLESEDDFAAALTNDAGTPVYAASDGSVQLSQTTYGGEGEAADGSYSVRSADFYVDPPDFSDGAAADVVAGPLEEDITVTHEIPSEHIGIQVRRHLADFQGELHVEIDGQIVGAYYASTEYSEDLQWVDMVGGQGWNVDSDDSLSEPDDPPTLEPGTHTIRISVEAFEGTAEYNTPEGNCNIDYFALFDDRHPPDFPTSTDANNALSGPQTYPESITATFSREEPFGAVEAATLTTTWADGDVSKSQALALSNDRGGTWTEQSNTSSIDVLFEQLGPSIEFEATLSRLDSGSTSTPTTGDATQSLESATLSVDTSGSPIVESRVFRDSLLEVCKSLADRGDVLFEVQVIDGEIGFVLTYPGQRSADVSPELIDYSVSKKPMERVNGLRISGRTETISREEFTAQNDGYSLEHDSIKEGSETVRDPETNEILERGSDADYQMAYGIGEIRRATGSEDMVSGETYVIDYSWQPSAEIVRSGEDELRRRARNIPELVSEQECREAVHYLLRELEQIPWEASIEISNAVGWSLVDAIDPDELPGDGPYRVRSLDETPESVTAELGRGSTVDEAVQELRGRLSSTEREV